MRIKTLPMMLLLFSCCCGMQNFSDELTAVVFDRLDSNGNDKIKMKKIHKTWQYLGDSSCPRKNFALLSRPQLYDVFLHKLAQVKILDFLGVKEFMRIIPSKQILVQVLRLYRQIIETEIVKKEELVSKVFFAPNGILLAGLHSKTFQEEFEKANKKDGGFFEFFQTYLSESENHYTADLSIYAGEEFDFPANFVDEIKRYERWERGINSPEVFRFVFYVASLLISVAFGDIYLFKWKPLMTDHLLNDKSDLVERMKAFVCMNVLGTGFHYIILCSPVITAMKSIFPDFADFSNRYTHRTVVISASIFMSIATLLPYFMSITMIVGYNFALIFVAVAIMFQIFYVAHKRKNIEKFSQHQNATICFVKCVSLVVLQLTFGCVLRLIKLTCAILPRFCVDFYLLNFVFYFAVPNGAFHLVNTIGENSWRKLIKNFRYYVLSLLSKKNMIVLGVGLLLSELSLVFKIVPMVYSKFPSN